MSPAWSVFINSFWKANGNTPSRLASPTSIPSFFSVASQMPFPSFQKSAQAINDQIKLFPPLWHNVNQKNTGNGFLLSFEEMIMGGFGICSRRSGCWHGACTVKGWLPKVDFSILQGPTLIGRKILVKWEAWLLVSELIYKQPQIFYSLLAPEVEASILRSSLCIFQNYLSLAPTESLLSPWTYICPENEIC